MSTSTERINNILASQRELSRRREEAIAKGGPSYDTEVVVHGDPELARQLAGQFKIAEKAMLRSPTPTVRNLKGYLAAKRAERAAYEKFWEATDRLLEVASIQDCGNDELRQIEIESGVLEPAPPDPVGLQGLRVANEILSGTARFADTSAGTTQAPEHRPPEPKVHKQGITELLEEGDGKCEINGVRFAYDPSTYAEPFNFMILGRRKSGRVVKIYGWHAPSDHE